MARPEPGSNEDTRYYKGQRIARCEYVKGFHPGNWIVQGYHITGVPLSDELCLHYYTLADAKQAIKELQP